MSNTQDHNREAPAVITFLSIAEFKQAVNLPANEAAQVVRNPNSTKLFLAIGSKTFKCQQTIDASKEMKILVENDNYSEACLTNVKPSAENVLFTL